jgi:broad specificity phosphatase PhoE
MRIYFVRHGESHANQLREISNRGLRHGLTRQGRMQALTLADHLRGQDIVRIYCSPLLRALETGILLANQLGLDYEVSDALREYDCGIAEGRSDAQAWGMWQEIFDAWVQDKRWEERIEGGESFYNIRDRFVPFIEGLLHDYQDSESGIVCVSHGGTYWMMLPQVLENLDYELISKQEMGYTTCILTELHPQGLRLVEWDGKPVS